MEKMERESYFRKKSKVSATVKLAIDAVNRFMLLNCKSNFSIQKSEILTNLIPVDQSGFSETLP